MGKQKVQVGDKFGKLTVIEKAEPYIAPSGYRTTRYLCKCECGNSIIVPVTRLRGGQTTSCGCNKKPPLIGKRFGRLVVEKELESALRNGAKHRRVLCRCDCGNEKIVFVSDLTSNHVNSCGCIRFKDLTGKRFTRLTVLSQADTHREPSGKAVVMWNVRCDCGKEFVVSGASLRSGNTQSCGCYNKDKVKETMTTHGKSRYRLYRIWSGMKQRCYNPNTHNYNHYGGRGIRLCDEWLNDFQTFYDWAMENGYDSEAKRGECTIDRIDNDGNYCPENCRWVGMDVQEKSENKRPSFPVTINGITKTAKDWCKIYGMNYSTVLNRIHSGWDRDKAITTPLLRKRKQHS